MAPGPVPIHKSVLQKLSLPIIHHRTDEFTAIFKESLLQLKDVFQTKQPVLIIGGTGSAAMEAAITNTLSTDDEVLVISNGKFSKRWATMAEVFSLSVDVFTVPYQHDLDMNKFTAQLAKKNYKAVFCQAVETSTGHFFDIKNIGKTIKSHNQETLFIVDGITAVGVSNINMSIEDIDVLVAGSQKAFMLPAGLSFICLSKKAWEANQKSNLPKYYFNLAKEVENNLKNQSYFSSLTSHIIALNHILKEGTGDKRQLRIDYAHNCARAFQTAVVEMGLELFAKMPAPSLTAIKVPEHIDGLKLKKDMTSKFNITVMGGQDDLKGQIIRVGHMGYITKENYQRTLSSLQECLEQQDSQFNKSKLENSLTAFETLFDKDYHECFNY